MQTASVWLLLDKHGSNVQLLGVTPPEVAVLRVVHSSKDQLTLLKDATYTGDVVDSQPLNRLVAKYGSKPVLTAFPGTNPVLPTTFGEVKLEVSGLPEE